MENLDPPPSPPNQGWENGAFLPFARLHPWFGGGDGGLPFHFILSKTVGPTAYHPMYAADHFKKLAWAIEHLASHAGVFRGALGEGWKTSSPKNAWVGGYWALGQFVHTELSAMICLKEH